jgi:uncharacterized membrane protein (DUF2068 family)
MDKRPIAISGMALVLAALGATFVLVAFGAIRVAENGIGWMAVVFGVGGILAIVLGYGLFTLKSWAWPLGIVMVAISAGLALLSVISRGSLAWLVLSLLPAIFLLGGLALPDVRASLGRERRAK